MESMDWGGCPLQAGLEFVERHPTLEELYASCLSDIVRDLSSSARLSAGGLVGVWSELAQLGLGGRHTSVALTCPGGMTWDEWRAGVPHCHLRVGREGEPTRLLNRPSWLLDSGDTVRWVLDTLYF